MPRLPLARFRCVAAVLSCGGAPPFLQPKTVAAGASLQAVCETGNESCRQRPCMPIAASKPRGLRMLDADPINLNGCDGEKQRRGIARAERWVPNSTRAGAQRKARLERDFENATVPQGRTIPWVSNQPGPILFESVPAGRSPGLWRTPNLTRASVGSEPHDFVASRLTSGSIRPALGRSLR